MKGKNGKNIRIRGPHWCRCFLCPAGHGLHGWKLRRAMREHIIIDHDMDYDAYIYCVNHHLFGIPPNIDENEPTEKIILCGYCDGPSDIDDFGD